MYFAPGLDERCAHLVTHPLVNRCVSDHTMGSSNLYLACLELRLDQQHQVTSELDCRDKGRQDASQRDEREIGGDQLYEAADGRRRCVTDVEPLKHCDSLIVPDLWMELPVADVERNYMASAALQKAIGEATGARSRIQDAPTCHVDGERRESGVQFLAAAADESCRRS